MILHFRIKICPFNNFKHLFCILSFIKSSLPFSLNITSLVIKKIKKMNDFRILLGFFKKDSK